MLQRPTILVKPSSTSNTSNNETETKLLVNEVNILAESKASVSLSQLTRTREPTPEHSNNPKLLVNGGENISLSNGKINKTINFVNLINKTTNDTSSNGNVLVNNNNKLKVKRELVTPLINNQKENQASHAQAQQQQQPANVLVQNQPSSSSSQQLMATPVIMTNAVKVLDDNLQWCDSLQEFLIDQNDFLVIGVLGKRGVGKSTIMSLLANGGGGVGSSGHISKRSNDVFSKASKDSNELGLHRTSGIQAFVTNERTILLDVQVEFLLRFTNST
jgi:ATPase subunit of ABC transporter with duplicated ATPase domains